MPDNSSLLIGVDASTTACKAVIWDLAGNSISIGRSALTISMPRPGWHEQPAESWWTALTRALRQALRGIDPNRLAGLAIAHQRETFVPVDEKGEPLRPGIVWMDERAAGNLPELEQSLGREHFHHLTGKPLSANLTATKIAWLREHEPELFARTAHYLDVHAYLVRRLTGENHTGWGSADPTGLFDMANHCWSKEILTALGLKDEQMPQAFPPASPVGRVTRFASRRTGLPEGLPVIAGLGDGQAGGVGANICQPGTAYLTLGTSVISGSFSERFVVNPAFRTMYGGVPGSCLLETVLLGGTYTLDWLMKTFLGKSGAAAARLREKMEGALDWIPAGSEGLLLVPYWNTVMNPYWDASASGIVVGWRGIHRPEHLYRAILEGIALELRLHFYGVEQALGIPLNRIIAMGGGSRSDRWLQIIADVTGKPVYRTTAGETTALGAAILAAAGTWLYPSVGMAAQAMAHWQPEAFQPEPALQRFYTDMYEKVYHGLYPALRMPLNSLAGLTSVERSRPSGRTKGVVRPEG